MRALADGLLRAAVAGPVRRAAEEGLVWRWKGEAEARQRLVAEHARGLAEWVVGVMVQTAVRGVGREELERKDMRREVLRGWRVGAERRRVNRLEEEERRKRFREVAGQIGVGPEVGDEVGEDSMSVSSSRLRGLTLGQPAGAPGRSKMEQALAKKVESVSQTAPLPLRKTC